MSTRMDKRSQWFNRVGRDQVSHADGYADWALYRIPGVGTGMLALLNMSTWAYAFIKYR